MVDFIVRNVKEYYNKGVIDSIKKNSHMNNYKGEDVSEEAIKAILVDFTNFLAMESGIDLAMYTKYLND